MQNAHTVFIQTFQYFECREIFDDVIAALHGSGRS